MLQLVKQLADDIREKVKGMGYERYKLIVQCELGEKKGQAINMVSRCLWDTSTDGFVSESYVSETLFCNCQVRLHSCCIRRRSSPGLLLLMQADCS